MYYLCLLLIKNVQKQLAYCKELCNIKIKKQQVPPSFLVIIKGTDFEVDEYYRHPK